jgi:hypothetical protein
MRTKTQKNLKKNIYIFFFFKKKLSNQRVEMRTKTETEVGKKKLKKINNFFFFSKKICQINGLKVIQMDSFKMETYRKVEIAIQRGNQK